MSKPLKVVGIVAGVVAVVATGGAALGLGLAVGGAVIPAATIATVASLTATAANLGSQALAKPPPARGNVAQVSFDPNAPTPYVMGEGYVGGIVRYDVGYGGEVDDVQNPYRWMPTVYSGGGPVQSISPRVDFGTVGSYYTGFLATDTQLGATPESSALAASYGSPPGWGASYKLSGQAAIGWNFKFDKKGKKFASGIPLLGAYGQWVKVYDPRLDSTFPGGSGSHRLGVESTYTWSDNPALHAGTYAYGRYQNGKLVMGIGLPAEGIDWETVAAWANTCDLNGWSIFGRVFEPGDRGQNLIDICMAGGGEPVFANAVLSFKFAAPVVALDTITDADLAEDYTEATAMQSYRDRINTIVPRYISANHNWELVAAEAVSVSTYVTEDGEERKEEWPFNLVKDVDQAAQLAAYRLVDAREIHPIKVVCHPRMRAYRPGDCLHLELYLGEDDPVLDIDAIILTRSIDPATMKVTFTLMSETASKHAYALGLTGTPPETPALGQTGEEADIEIGTNLLPPGYVSSMISQSFVTDADPADGLIQAVEASGTTTITVESHTRTYPDLTAPLSITGDSITTEDDGTTAITTETTYHLYYDDYARAGGAVTILATQTAQDAATKPATPGRHYIGSITTPDVGGSTQGGGSAPPGWDGDAWCVADDTPILLASGIEVPARELEVGTKLRTRHEHTLEWGDFEVEAISFNKQPVLACEIVNEAGETVTIRATADHRFWIGGEWVRAHQIGRPNGEARIARITVADAHTYVSAGVLSHNAKADPLGP